MRTDRRQGSEYTFADLHDLVFPSEVESTGYFAVTFNCFLDGSKDKSQEKVMVSAGFFARIDDWASLRSGWNKVLTSHNMSYFKSSEYYGLTGEFKQFRKYKAPKGREAATQVRTELQDVLQSNRRIVGIGVMVLLDAYYSVLARPEASQALPQNAYCTALNSVMFETVKLIKKIDRHGVVAFVHDNGPDFDSLRGSYEQFRKLNRNTAKKMAAFVPLDDTDHAELQAADMVSNYTMQLGLEGLENGNMRANVKEMRSNITKIGFWDEKYALSVLKHKLVRHGKPLPLDLEDRRYG